MLFFLSFKMVAKVFFQTFLLVSLAMTFSCATDEMKSIVEFLDKFKHINVIDILSNDRLFAAYTKCFMGTGPCTSDAKEMRDVIPPLVKSACAECSDEQKKDMKRHLEYIRVNRQKEWDELLDKFDPKRESLERFLSSVPE